MITSSKTAKRRASVLFTLLIFASPLFSATSAEEKQIAELYRRGLAGDATAVERCIEKLDMALKQEPQNHLARVYLGSTYTLRSRDMGFGPKKLQVVRQGCRTMDEAVAAAPENPKVRLVRALTDQSLPFFLGRKKTAQEDWHHILSILGRNPRALTEDDLQVVYYTTGIAAKETGNRPRAEELLAKAAEHPVDPALAAKVNAARGKK